MAASIAVFIVCLISASLFGRIFAPKDVKLRNLKYAQLQAERKLAQRIAKLEYRRQMLEID